METLLDKTKFMLRKLTSPRSFRETGGTIDLNNPTGEITIPVNFEIGHIESNVFLLGEDPNPDFLSPCSPIPHEFINVDFLNDPVNKLHSIHITWSVNSYRTLVWKASGFTCK